MKRNFVLLDPRTRRDTGAVFSGSSPSGAAKKAATRGAKTILLRETGSKAVYEYKGSVKIVSPRRVMINGKAVVYSRIPVVKSVGKFVRG